MTIAYWPTGGVYVSLALSNLDAPYGRSSHNSDHPGMTVVIALLFKLLLLCNRVPNQNPTATAEYIYHSSNVLSTLLTLPMTAITEKEKPSTHSNITIEELKLGVWNLKIGKNTTTGSKNLAQRWEEIKSAVPVFHRLSSDIFALAPGLSTLFVFCQIFQGLEDAVSMRLSSALLRRVCHTLFETLKLV